MGVTEESEGCGRREQTRLKAKVVVNALLDCRGRSLGRDAVSKVFTEGIVGSAPLLTHQPQPPVPEI